MLVPIYHGAPDLHTALRPGLHPVPPFKKLDHVDANEWLYGYSNINDAILQSVSAAICKFFVVDEICDEEKLVLITLKNTPGNLEKLAHWTAWFHGLRTWYYAIEYEPSQGWVKLNNPRNRMLVEWKTRGEVEARWIERIVRVRPAQLFSDSAVHVEFQTQTADGMAKLLA